MMTEKKISKKATSKKTTKRKRRKSEKRTPPKKPFKIEEVKPKSTRITLHDNSFAICVSNVTGIPEDIFDNIDYIIKNLGVDNWYQSYLKVLKFHSYDMIFFSYHENPLEISEEKPLENYQFNNLPSGKCIILGLDDNDLFHCAVGISKDSRIVINYDPNPTEKLAKIIQIGFFINTFVTPSE